MKSEKLPRPLKSSQSANPKKTQTKWSIARRTTISMCTTAKNAPQTAARNKDKKHGNSMEEAPKRKAHERTKDGEPKKRQHWDYDNSNWITATKMAIIQNIPLPEVNCSRRWGPVSSMGLSNNRLFCQVFFLLGSLQSGRMYYLWSWFSILVFNCKSAHI